MPSVLYLPTLTSSMNRNLQYVTGSKYQTYYMGLNFTFSRDDYERQPIEALTISGVITGSEIRVVNLAAGTEAVAGVESFTNPLGNGKFIVTYHAPVTPTPCLINILKPGYYVVSKEVTLGAGSISFDIIQKVNGAYNG